MAEELNKNEDATPYKLQEARKRGQVARSLELPSFFSLLAMSAVLIATVASVGSLVANYTAWWLGNADFLAQDNARLIAGFSNFVAMTAIGIAPIIFSGVVAAVVVSVISTGPVFSMHPITPDFSKLNPAKGFEKIFSRRALVELMKLIVKLGLFIGVAYLVWGAVASYVLNPNQASLTYVLAVWHKVLFKLTYALLGVFLISAIFDWWYSRKDFSRQMKMSTRDVKDEVKRREGDPEIKAKRKRIVAELLKAATSVKNVKDADVIITNPTHVSIALQYRPSSMVLPVVISKGRGVVAAAIRVYARRYGIPIIRKPELARQLMKTTKIGMPIPVDKQKPIASIYRWVVSIPGNKVLVS